jgi:hypothetical protein
MICPMPLLDPEQGVVVKTPERPEPGYWVGCPGMSYDPGSGQYLMTYRERRPREVAPERGWRCAIAASSDGLHFEDVWEVRKDQLSTSSMERFSLVRGPAGKYQLYVSYVDPADGRWRIDVLEAESPEGFDIGKAAPVLTAASTGSEGVKDPYVLRVGPVTYLFASLALARPMSADERERAHSTGDIYNTGLTTHPTGMATSLDGAAFTWHGPVLGVGGPDSWDRYQARINCLLPAGPLYVALYDGSAGAHENYEERCGVATSADLRHWERLSTDGPWLSGPRGTGSVRYLDVLAVDGQWHAYYEMARADGAHELRMLRVPMG